MRVFPSSAMQLHQELKKKKKEEKKKKKKGEQKVKGRVCGRHFRRNVVWPLSMQLMYAP